MIVTDCVPAYVPAARLNVGAAGGGFKVVVVILTPADIPPAVLSEQTRNEYGVSEERPENE